MTDLHWKFTNDEDKFLNQTQDVITEHRIAQISPDKNAMRWKVYFNFRETTSNFMDKVLNYIEDPITSDIEVRVADTSFNCHMYILQSYSNFFLNHSRHEKVIELDGERVSAEIFYKIYRWMLSSSKSLERECLIGMMSSAEYLQIEKLLKQCWEIVKQLEWFQEQEAFLLYLDAKEKKIEKVQALMRQQVKRYFLTVICTRDFLEMEADEVANWLKMDSIGINCEVEIFFIVSRWLLYNWKERQVHLMDLMQHVRFPLIETWRLFQFIHNKDTGELKEMLKNQELSKHIEKSINYSAYRQSFKDEFSEHFCDFLNRSGYKRVHQRELIIDPYWCENFKKIPFNYEDFLRYLSAIRSNVEVHWMKITFNDVKKNLKANKK